MRTCTKFPLQKRPAQLQLKPNIYKPNI